MKKKITAIVLVVIVLAMLFTGMTLAYFTDEDDATNVFTYGDVSIDVKEKGKDGQPVDEIEYKDVFPGGRYVKTPYIVNDGTSGAYVRIGVKVNRAALLALTGETAVGNTDALLEELVDINTTCWKFAKVVAEEENGEMVVTLWYDYLDNGGILAAGEASAHLFTKVNIPAEVTYDDLNGLNDKEKFTLVILGQAVQTASFDSYSAAFAAAFPG